MLGGGGNDKLLGEDDNDFLSGGYGSDTLTGGSGADKFHFQFASEGVDTITDFQYGEGDKILVNAIGFGIGQGEYYHFTFQESATGGALFFEGIQLALLQPGSGFDPNLDITIV
jgi:Ca2+-binding RTX toxin-like protein